MSINTEILNKVQKINNNVYINKDKILNTRHKQVAIRHISDELFGEEFGIDNFSEFQKVLSTFSENEISFEKNGNDVVNIIIEDKKSRSKIIYRVASKVLCEDQIESNQKADGLFNLCKESISNEHFFSFELSESEINNFVKMGSTFKAGDKKSYIRFTREMGEDFQVKVYNKSSDNVFLCKKEVDDRISLKNIDVFFDINKLISGNYKCYMIDSSVDKENKIKLYDIALYCVDEENKVELLIQYDSVDD